MDVVSYGNGEKAYADPMSLIIAAHGDGNAGVQNGSDRSAMPFIIVELTDGNAMATRPGLIRLLCH